MQPVRNLSRRRLVAQLATAATLATLGLASAAIAGTFSLQVVKNGTVRNQSGTVRQARIVTNSRGFAVYELRGDSQRHPECTSANGCFSFWPPVTVSSAKHLTKAHGISGKLGTWRRNGFTQVTLAGHPLYRFAPDTKRGVATGEGVRAFGGTWHVVRAAGAGSGPAGTPAPAPSTMTPAPCAYPPCY